MNAPAKVEAALSNVYAKIAAVQGELAKVGISKSRKNQTPGAQYNFRGIDEIYNTLAPLMAEPGLCIIPRIVDHSLTERGKTRNGNIIWSAVVTAEFDFVSADDGSVHTARTIGEAMDSSDKASNKAMSAAYKYAALMTFAIPTEGDNDADAQTHEVAAKPDVIDEPCINDEQITRIQGLLEATTINVVQFCRIMGCRTVSSLPVSKFAEAVERLEKKLAELAKKETDAKAREVA